MNDAVSSTTLPLPLVARGKVRDVYAVGDDRLLIVATDRISAFDVVLPQPIPFKGAVLTQLTAWWLARLGDITPNHLVSADTDTIAAAVPALADTRDVWGRRAMLVKRAKVVPIECVVRGFISGSAWSEYRKAGTLAGEPLPQGLQESQRLDPPIFSPATKAETGHDENITFAQMTDAVGAGLANDLRARSLAIYQRGRDVAEQSGIIVADTKFEFGTLADGTLVLIDEVLTPDSSRFWPKESYSMGRGQPSLDKQPVRDFLEALVGEGRWDKTAPGPDLPGDVIEATSQRYRAVFQRLTGYTLDEFPSADPGATPEDRKS
ncbi:MAG TPA: phosphoribosylaminoimidazolesuccinocarboxamide synthase [Longimicrobiales bacterium]|nr:phosphoribosylaminoimidazolesuccinocarboxamide synthase [Longimicrobiales bacterium]